MMANSNEDRSDSMPGSMGLRGIWFQISNLTAISIILLMFYQDRHESLKVANEDRKMFREELREQRVALDKLSNAVDKMAEEIRRNSK